ncbi:MAG TPA: diguanylate cyclase [Verrucomicrobiae bacterium]|jgi:diguanylate cyclase (GGDEF)-like protein|nr:diguanylate cyclase [Verrucomicrobiae bacterium]
MNNVVITTVLIPGIVSVLLYFVFTYLREQSRQPYFRAWQLAWAFYSLHYVLDAFPESPTAFLVSQLFLLAMTLCIFISTRLMRASYRFQWYDAAVAAAGITLAGLTLRGHIVNGMFRPDAQPSIRLGIALAAILLYCSAVFYVNGHRRGSLAFQVLGVSLALWAVLTGMGELQNPWLARFGSASRLFGPVPEMLLGIAMVMVLFENQRNAVLENTLALSTLGVDPSRLLFAEDLIPSMQAALDRLMSAVPARRAAICITERWRGLLPSVQRGFSPGFIESLETSGAAEYICELAYRQSGIVTVQDVAEMTESFPLSSRGKFADFKRILTEAQVSNLTAVTLQTREHNFGVILFPHAERKAFGTSGPRLMVGLALQLGLTLENYVVSHDAHRRTKEYELLTDIGKAISSRLDQDEILRTIQIELGQIFDTSNFYIAFRDDDEIRFEMEVRDNQILPKRTRERRNAFTEYVIRTGEPLLVRSNLETTRKRLGISHVPERPAKCIIAAPIFVRNKATGAMVAMNAEREFVFEQRDLDVLVTAAGQVSVAMENARLFAEEQRRSRQLAFLNNISRTAISSDDPGQMLGQIVEEIQRNFSFDHIGIGLLDYGTKEIEIKAEAGATAHAMGRRIPLGTGILGRVARTGERALVQNAAPGNITGILADSRAVLCIPMTYGESLLGVLNIESRTEDAFSPQDVLILNTLADLLATALHNAFVFQKLQQQSITDGLTGIKTRRFFWEALSAEWKRASRSGRPFSVVLVDLDKFKEVNDTMGHFEGDLVLARVGRLLEQKSRQSNVVARYGGDEFIILMPETGAEQAQVLAERLRQWMLDDPMLAEHHITGSFGVASFPMHGFSIEDIIRVADAGMYVSKRSGGNQVSTAQEFVEGEHFARQRQQISAYVEGFLQRTQTGPEQVNELTSMLRKLCCEEGEEECNVALLKEAIESLSRAAESRELQTSGHGDLVARYTGMIARAMHLSPEETGDLVYAARVHDVGKIFIPERILNKPGPLTDEEFRLIKTHAHVGAEIVNIIPGSEKMRLAIEHHHQRFDGSGYPDALKGEQIPLWARIIALTDAYANMVTEHAIGTARTPEQALEELSKMSGTCFDGMLVRLFLRELKSDRASTPAD